MVDLVGSDIVQRLKAADKDSVQRINGSRIFAEAADKIEGLAADLESSLECLWKRGDRTARLWCKTNYPAWSAGRFDPDAT